MKLWIDDIRPAPEGYVGVKSVDDAKDVINYSETMVKFYKYILDNDELPEWIRASTEQDLKEVAIDIIDTDYDAGDLAIEGDDYICLFDWLEETGCNYHIRIHSMNPYGAQCMRQICEKNGWKIV